MKQEKQALRKVMIEQLLALPAETIHARSEKIAEQVCTMEAFQQADTVCVFISLPGEVDTAPIIQACRAAGKKTAAPRIKDGAMEFYLFNSEEDLEPGYYGIREPVGNSVPEGRTLVIMSGVLFDQTCRRIGRGGGYYDRYLAAHPELEALAVAFDMQVLDQIPDEPHDLRPKYVVTEKQTIGKRL